MKTLLALLVLGGLMACGEAEERAPPIPDGPLEWSVRATADKSEIQVGEDLTVHGHGESSTQCGVSSCLPAPSSSPSSSSSGWTRPPSPVETVITVEDGGLSTAGVKLPYLPSRSSTATSRRRWSRSKPNPYPSRLVTSLTPGNHRHQRHQGTHRRHSDAEPLEPALVASGCTARRHHRLSSFIRKLRKDKTSSGRNGAGPASRSLPKSKPNERFASWPTNAFWSREGSSSSIPGFTKS